MKRLFSRQTLTMALLFGAVHSLVLAYIGDIAASLWGRPRGVAYGILGYYYWLGLSIYGFAIVFVFRSIPVRYALMISVIFITAASILLLPDRGERPFLSVYFGAIIMCLALATWEHHRIKRREPSD